MRGYILTYSKFYRENICQLWILNRVDLNFCVRSTPCGRRRDNVLAVKSRKLVLLTVNYLGVEWVCALEGRVGAGWGGGGGGG